MDQDSFADIHIGRFPAATETHVTSMVQKTISYETDGIDSWISNAVFMASEDSYWISEGTHDYVIDTYLDSRGY